MLYTKCLASEPSGSEEEDGSNPGSPGAGPPGNQGPLIFCWDHLESRGHYLNKQSKGQ